MKGAYRDPVDHARTTHQHAGESLIDTLWLPAAERGQEGVENTPDGQNSVIVKVPHFPQKTKIRPEDLQNQFVFGSRRQQLRSVEEATAKALMRLKRNDDITLEFMRTRALKGVITDGKGVTLLNLYTAFGITQKSVDFVLGTDSTKVIDKCEEVVGHIQDNLNGEVMNGVHALVDQTFFTKFVQHPKVKEFYTGWQQAMTLAQRPVTGFPFYGIVWEPYRGTAPLADGSAAKFIAANDGSAFPTGTMDTFKTWLAPAHHIDYVNTPGVRDFVSPKVLDHGQGIELAGQLNAIPTSARPALMVRCYSSN